MCLRCLTLSRLPPQRCSTRQPLIAATLDTTPTDATHDRGWSRSCPSSRRTTQGGIAERLTLSVRTVEGHVYRAMAKTAISSREELAVLLHPDGPTSDASVVPLPR
ncbi:MAG TPA: LuxR C-terminal-related transcriptional regulator [Mycobacterium sp.]|nr:LuxR C-terminal-related transcriptional regulator [Mycobacterium sp.]